MKQIENEQSLEFIFRNAPNNERCLLQLLARGRTKGFDNFISRKLIWPFLLNLEYDKIEDQSPFQWKGEIDRNSSDYEQLKKDAERSLSSMKTFETINKVHLKKRQDDVLMVLDNFFGHHTDLRYIQGFHDVTSVFLTIFGNNIGYYMMQKAGKIYFHDFLKYDVGHIGMNTSSIIWDLVIAKDPQFDQIFGCFKESKFLIFIIPWIFTWFSHVFDSLKTICRIWDYILCTGPFGSIYLAAGIILNTKEQLLAHCQELDQANIQSFYQELAKNQQLNIQQVIQKAIEKAIQLQQSINVRQLSGYRQFKQDSMFRFQNFYTEINLIQKYHNYLEKKKSDQRRKNLIRFGVYTLLIAGGVTIALYHKNSHLKHFFKGLIGGEL